MRPKFYINGILLIIATSSFAEIHFNFNPAYIPTKGFTGGYVSFWSTGGATGASILSQRRFRISDRKDWGVKGTISAYERGDLSFLFGASYKYQILPPRFARAKARRATQGVSASVIGDVNFVAFNPGGVEIGGGLIMDKNFGLFIPYWGASTSLFLGIENWDYNIFMNVGSIYRISQTVNFITELQIGNGLGMGLGFYYLK
ncbi:hypothetical protein KAW65_03485 [candidate division WOR-3 bacterium]|nr:hypothetical protein [candidate division WOR-3 bacterium]